LDRRTFLKWSTSAAAGIGVGTNKLAAGLLRAGAFGNSALAPQVSAIDSVAVGLTRPNVIPLDGDWHFKEDPKEIGEQEGWYRPGSIKARMGKVPLPWEIAFPELRDFKGTGWYAREFVVPAQYRGKRIALATMGISDHATIWINGKPAGEHRGAQAPFSFDITFLLRPGSTNSVSIRASDPAGSFMDYESLILCSGLWQSIWLEITGKTFIGDIFMVPDIDRSRAEARVTILASEKIPRERHLSLSIAVTGPDGRHVEKLTDIVLHADEILTRVVAPIEVEDAQLWDIDAPNLYHTQATLIEKGSVLDRASVDFGMRKIETQGNCFFLNNKPIYFVGGGVIPGPGWGDCDWHHPPPYHNPTDEEIRKDIKMIKSTGVNWIRIALRPASARFLYWADRMGLLVWQGAGWTLSQPVKGDKLDQYKKWLSALILRDHNHPSLVMWEMMNEGGGNSWESLKELTARLYDFAKGLDETRLILDDSGGWSIGVLNDPGNHGKTDVDDWHNYPPFGNFNDTRDLIAGLRSYGKPLVLSEFGPIPYIFNADRVKQEWGGIEPWWMTARSKEFATMVIQAGFEQRFYRWNLDKVYGDFTAFTEASDWYYFEGLKQQTDWMRMNPEVAGYVAWMFDSTPHPIGVIDYFKNKKVFCPELSKIWGQNAVVVDIVGRRNFWEGETIKANVYLTHFGENTPLAGDLKWRLDGVDLQGTLGNVSVPSGKIRPVGSIEFQAPKVNGSTSLRLIVELDRDGTIVCQNYVTILLVPAQFRAPKLKTVIFRGDFAWELEALGYELKKDDPTAPVVTTKINEEVLGFLEQGKTVLLLACGDWVPGATFHLVNRKVDPSVRPFLNKFGLELASKSQGGHGDCFFVKKDTAMFERIPFKNPIAWAFQQAWPQQVIVGVKGEHHADMLAGAYGVMIWSRTLDPDEKPHVDEINATILRCRYGKGRLIISTFELLTRSINDDPVVTIMLNDLISHTTEAFEPGLRLQ
jgi:hypothetical protein